jgi:hypothetical protein
MRTVYIYRIIADMKVKTFKADVIVFIGNLMICLTSHWSIIFSIMVSSMIGPVNKKNYFED